MAGPDVRLSNRPDGLRCVWCFAVLMLCFQASNSANVFGARLSGNLSAKKADCAMPLISRACSETSGSSRVKSRRVVMSKLEVGRWVRMKVRRGGLMRIDESR